jgi:hypothetical protein
MLSTCLLFAYFSPETLLPVGSIVATVLGVAMMLGRGSVRFLIRSCKRLFRPSAWIAGVSQPHFRLGEHAESQVAHADSNSQSLETRS